MIVTEILLVTVLVVDADTAPGKITAGTLDAGMPRYRIEILFVPVGGAVLNVSVVPLIVYVLGSCVTPVITTSIDVVLAGATDIVNAVVTPFPL